MNGGGTTLVKAFLKQTNKTTALILGRSIMNPEGTKEKRILYIYT